MIPHSRPTLGVEEKRACAEVIDSLHLAQGRKVQEFEKAFCAFTGRRYAVAVSSGTAALHLALCALGAGKSREVIIPSYTCAALLHPVVALSARPVFADIEAEDFNMSAADTGRKINKRTLAVIVPHLFGRAARMSAFEKLGVPVIEDGTQSIGAAADGRKVGSFGAVSVFSFYATKMITTGEGGMVVTDSKKMAEAVRDMRDYDKKDTFKPRTNSKMTDLEAAMGLVQLGKLPEFIRLRRSAAAAYDGFFRAMSIEPPASSSARDHVYFRYVVRVKGKNASTWERLLNRAGIEAKSPVFKPLHRYLRLPDARFPETVKAMKETLSLPIFPAMTEAQIAAVGRACAEILEKSGRKACVEI